MKNLVVLLIALSCAGALRADAALRVHGSTTVEGAIEPKLKDIEREAGSRVELTANGSMGGLADLAAGRADIAMISSPLDDVAKRINGKTPGAVDPSGYLVEQVGQAKIAFVVHPKNPVKKLSAKQIADLLTGKIQNWREVGGTDSPVLVVSIANGGSLIQETFLHGTPITKDARTLANANQIPVVVAQFPNAIGIISTAHSKGKTSLVETELQLIAPLFLVTKGEPSPEAKKVISACRAALVERLSENGS
jgi:phosphate transport system substrate-binding protein